MTSTPKEELIPHIQVRRTIKAPQKKVFDAWAKSALLEKWLYPLENWTASTSSEFKVGGTFKHEMMERVPPLATNRELQEAGNDRFICEGTYLVIDPPKKLMFTWNSKFVRDTQVKVELKKVKGGTEIIIRHENINGSTDQEQQKARWEGCLESLERLLT